MKRLSYLVLIPFFLSCEKQNYSPSQQREIANSKQEIPTKDSSKLKSDKNLQNEKEVSQDSSKPSSPFSQNNSSYFQTKKTSFNKETFSPAKPAPRLNRLEWQNKMETHSFELSAGEVTSLFELEVANVSEESPSFVVKNSCGKSFKAKANGNVFSFFFAHANNMEASCEVELFAEINGVRSETLTFNLQFLSQESIEEEVETSANDESNPLLLINELSLSAK